MPGRCILLDHAGSLRIFSYLLFPDRLVVRRYIIWVTATVDKYNQNKLIEYILL